MMPARRASFALLFVFAIATITPTVFASFKSKAAYELQEKVSLAGTWKGLIEEGATKFHLVLKLTQAPDGGYLAVVNSLDQSGDLDLLVDTIVFKGFSFRFEMKEIHAVFEGTVNADGTEIVGRWIQGGAAVLIFRREVPGAQPIKPFKRGSVKLEPCNLAKLTQEARCGKYEVFEDRAAARGRKIALNILILPATGDKPQPDPVFITDAEIAREATGTYYGDAKIRGGQMLCREWPSVKAPLSFIEPVKSDLPFLLISGDIDPVTPSWVAAGAAKQLPNAVQVTIKDGTHLTESPCITNLIAEFISKGSAKGLDTSCVNGIKRPPFTYQFPISFKPAGK